MLPKIKIKREYEDILPIGTPASDASFGDHGFPRTLQKILDREPKDILPIAKQKWFQLGPLKLEEIVRNSKTQIEYSLRIGKCSLNSSIIGQIDANGISTGVVRIEDSHCIYEGQSRHQKPNGYGRKIYFNGEYY